MIKKILSKIRQTNLRTIRNLFLVLAFLSLAFLVTDICAFADDECSRTSKAALRACHNEVQDDFYIAVGNCLNLASSDELEACREEALETLRESIEECRDQFDAREEICEDLGQGPYDPEIDPSNFPFTDGIIPDPNPFFPLVPGTTFVYEGGDETITVTVTDQIKEILGVNCIAVHDVAEENGKVIEDTFDWYAQDIDGNVWYFGEISQEFEDGELVSIDGSWKAGVEGAKPGIIMKANPEVGNVYRQEFFLGDAEDMAEVIDENGSETVPAANCSGDCLVTAEFTPIEPDDLENKFYAPGSGLILEIEVETGKRVELISITTE